MAIAGTKRKRTVKSVAKRVAAPFPPPPPPPPRKQTKKTTTAPSPPSPPPPPRDLTASTVPSLDAMGPQLARIAAASGRTAFERRVWALLCQIPAGRVSTYGLVAAHVGSSPRAVGNALRRNPFAPQVPCHRVVAAGGALGGFKGFPSRDGEGITIAEKIALLRREGVRVDARGRVLGTPWSGFVS
ncbi:putative RING-2 protein [Rosellinia necatrix]|uniref:Methylated-DNA--protein-cysteine methyltransferase n=1 Tax=Rosellinia necatrix TaxID=77044 RepID=A0A1W2TWQ5_ROSNE|nr:putative RING-2 protein [Rosellinia necatrix]